MHLDINVFFIKSILLLFDFGGTEQVKYLEISRKSLRNVLEIITNSMEISENSQI